MPRRKRIIHTGYPYHVMLRGNGGQPIFRDDEDRARFCLLMQYATELHDISVHGFCLMDNHIHLLLEPNAKGLSAGVHVFAFRYAQYFNKKYMLKGHLFQGRYKAVIVQNGTYLRRLIRYIHRNPVRALMVTSPGDYKWSSHRAYLDLDLYTWLTKHRILAMFEPDKAKMETGLNFGIVFETFMEANDADAKDQLEAIRRSSSLGAYGDLDFVKTFSDRETDELELAIRQEEGNIEVGLSDLISTVCEQFGVSEELLCGSSRHAEAVRARAALSLVATRSKIASLSDLALRLKRDHSSLSRLRRKAESDSSISYESNVISDRMVALLAAKEQ